MKAPVLILTAILLCSSFVPQAVAQQRTLRVTITSDNAYMFGFGDVNSIDPSTVAGAVFSRVASDIYGARVWDVQANGGALPPMESSTSYGPERYTVSGDIAGKYIYIVAWSDNKVWQGTIALFEDAWTGFRVATGPESPWEVYATGWNVNSGDRRSPALASVNTAIAMANTKSGIAPGSIGWVNADGCTDGSGGCRGTLLHCTEFTEARVKGFPDMRTNFGEGQFMWYRNPDYPDGSCDVPTTPAELSGEYLIFRFGPIEDIIPLGRLCDSIGLRFDPVPDQPCNVQAMLSNSAFASLYAVRLRILTEGIRFGDFQTRSGWTIDQAISGTEAVAHPPGDRIPFCGNASYFSFCLEGANPIDARIEIEWIADDLGMCRDTLSWSCEILPEARPCDSIALRLEASPENPCCAQARISNVALAPWYAVRLRILTEDVVFEDFQTRDGWTVDAAISGREAVAHPPTESIPFCSDASFFAFCLSGADSIDARIEVTWIASDSALCRDTLSLACAKGTSAIDEDGPGRSSTFRILSCSPDPVREHAAIEFSLDHAARVRFDVHDMLGRHRMTVPDLHQEAGRHSTVFDTANLPPGTYFLRMSAEGRATTTLFRVVK